jgi:carboxypeptidase Q
MRRCILSAFVLIIAVSSNGQAEDSLMIRKMATEILVNSGAYENLRYLTKQIGARLAGSQGMVKSEKWAYQALQQTGAGKVWMQECMVPYWVRGGRDEAFVTTLQSAGVTDPRLTKRPLDVIALGNSMGSGAKGVSAEVIEINSFEDLETKKDKVKGKIVFYNYHFKKDFVETFNGYSDAVKYRGAGPVNAAKYGAVAMILRSISHGENNHPHTGGTRYDSAYPKIPAVAVGLQDADWLSAEIKKKKTNLTIKTYGYFKPDTIGHNVIAEWKGSVYPNEIITVGAHLDSWDNCEGAHDDGAGCVQTIEILRAFKAIGYQPKRTIRFVLFANEENGVRGGNKYAQEAKEKNEQHVFALESDAGGFTPRGFGFTAKPEVFAKIKQWESLLAPYGGGYFAPEGSGVDIAPLNRTFGTTIAGLMPDSQRYFDYHHARNDVFEAVNKRELDLGAVNMAALIYLVDKYGL